MGVGMSAIERLREIATRDEAKAVTVRTCDLVDLLAAHDALVEVAKRAYYTHRYLCEWSNAEDAKAALELAGATLDD
jgi:hypothetical protein